MMPLYKFLNKVFKDQGIMYGLKLYNIQIKGAVTR